jgi:hypothetical protein
MPWCAVFDRRETTSAQKGVYPVLHFLTAGSPGIRIGLGVSYTEFKNRMSARSREVARQLTADEWTAVESRGFSDTSEQSDSPPARREYSKGMVFAKFVVLPDIRSLAEQLSGDLAVMLHVYRDWVGRYGGRAQPVEDAEETEAPVADEGFGLDWLRDTTYWTEEDLAVVLSTIRGRSPQIILAGPPGTGKTWVAERIAEHLTAGVKGRSRIVQFHPSYSYEQFIEGLRPVSRDGSIQFVVEPGHLRKFVNDISGTDPHVMILDEMNRANLPRVFGEMMYLFEYRQKEIDLSYTRGFTLPPNLLFIGTMNTADRSIRSIDIALRRRFDVFECPPDRQILERYYASDHTNQVTNLFEGFDALNFELQRLLDRHHTVGHSFFMCDSMTPDVLSHVWRHKIFPVIEEYFFDQPDMAKTFTVGRFWPGV